MDRLGIAVHPSTVQQETIVQQLIHSDPSSIGIIALHFFGSRVTAMLRAPYKGIYTSNQQHYSGANAPLQEALTSTYLWNATSAFIAIFTNLHEKIPG
jgi:hypothetical protein